MLWAEHSPDLKCTGNGAAADVTLSCGCRGGRLCSSWEAKLDKDPDGEGQRQPNNFSEGSDGWGNTLRSRRLINQQRSDTLHGAALFRRLRDLGGMKSRETADERMLFWEASGISFGLMVVLLTPYWAPWSDFARTLLFCAAFLSAAMLFVVRQLLFPEDFGLGQTSLQYWGRGRFCDCDSKPSCKCCQEKTHGISGQHLGWLLGNLQTLARRGSLSSLGGRSMHNRSETRRHAWSLATLTVFAYVALQLGLVAGQPSSTASSIVNLPSFGTGAVLTVTGTGYGSSEPTGTVRLGGSSCEQSTWISDSTVLCKTPDGLGAANNVVVTMTKDGSTQIGTLQSSVTFDSAILKQLQSSNAAGGSAAAITVTGKNIGVWDSTPMMRVNTAMKSTYWISDTSVKGIVPSGIRHTLAFSIEVASVMGAVLTEAFTYDQAAASVVTRVNGPTTGLASVTVHGSSFGMSAYTQEVRSGQTACEATAWISGTSVKCRTSGGVRRTSTVVLTVGESSGTSTEAWSTDASMVSTVTRTNSGATGLASVTVQGSSFGMAGYTQEARVGDTACEATDWTSETSVQCRTSGGVRRTSTVVLTVGESSGTATEAWSADTPAVKTVVGSNRAGTGSASVTVQGSSFGMAGYTQEARVGDTACEATDWTSETSVQCRTSGGVRRTSTVVLTVGESSGTSTEAWSTDASMVSTVTRTNSGATGLASVTVQGSSFGMAGYTQEARVGDTACEATDWTSETSVQCRTSGGVRRTSTVVLTVGESSGTATEAWSADTPAVKTVVGSNRAGTGSASVTVQGSSFGMAGYTQEARVGDTACEATDWTSETSVQCRTSGGVRRTSTVVLTVGESSGTATEAWSTDASMVSTVTSDEQWSDRPCERDGAGEQLRHGGVHAGGAGRRHGVRGDGLDVGDVGAVSDERRREADVDGGADGGGELGHGDGGVVDGCEHGQHCDSDEQWSDRPCERDGAGEQLRHGGVHAGGAGRRHGVRGDGLDVGDVGAVSDERRREADVDGGADGGGELGHGDGGVVGRHAGGEDGGRIEPGRDRVGERDGAGEQLRHGGVHAGGAGRRHGVRGDGLDVGDVGAVSDERRREADVDGGADGGGELGHGDGGVVDGCEHGQHCDSDEQWSDRPCERDGAGEQLRHGGVHAGGAGRRHGVRGDGLDVGDVGAVSDERRREADVDGGADGGGELGHGDGGVVGRHAGGEDGGRIEPGRDRVGERDGAGEQLRHGGVHAGGAGRRHGVRGDGLDVGDVGAVSDERRREADVDGGADGGGELGHGDGGVVGRHAGGEDGGRIEPGRDRVGERDGAGEQLRHGGVHAGGAGRRHGVRGDGLDVGDVGAVSDERRREADVDGGADGGGELGHGDGGVVDGCEHGQHCDSDEQWSDRPCERDGAGEQLRHGGVHAGGAGRRHGVRGDGLDVGDVGAVSDERRREADVDGGADGGGGARARRRRRGRPTRRR